MGYEDERDREQDRKFWEALTKKDYPQAIYHLSPRLYGMYLQAGEQRSRAEREALETQMKQTLAGLLFPTPDFALWLLEKWFGFGEFRDISPYANPERVQVLAELDAQQVAIVRAILEDAGMAIQDKVEAAWRVSQIKPDAPMGWGECQALAQVLQPYNLGFQQELEAWCGEMYRWQKCKSLGGSW